MGTLSLNVHSTKLLYATILKGLALWRQIRARRDMLAGMLPNIATQWDICQQVIAPCISRKVAITASLSKADTVPDETRVPPAIEINAGTVRLMYGLAGSLGLTLNTNDYAWFDEENNFKEALQNFSSVAAICLEIEQFAADLCMHRAYGTDLYSDQNESRTPGQLTFYTECDAPLADGIFVSQLNRAGMIAGFDSLYLGWMIKSIEQLVTTAPPDIESDLVEVTATPEDDPDHPGTITFYRFEAAFGWYLAGAVIAAQPDLAAPSTFYQTVVYDSDSQGHLALAGDYTDPAMPATVVFKLLLLKTT